MDRRFSRVKEKDDREENLVHLTSARKVCGNPRWTIEIRKTGKVKIRLETDKDKSKDSVVISCVKGLSESVAIVMKKHDISVSVQQHYKLKKALVYPEDKVKKGNTCGVVYEIP